MKWIKKASKGPECLDKLRSTPNATYRSLQGDCKESVRSQLLNEQGHLCAYCMKRISSAPNKELEKPFSTEIEHYEAQAGNKELLLNYNNMLAVCNGFSEQEDSIKGKKNKIKISHCDKTEGGKGDGNKKLRILDPRSSLCESLLKYSVTGEIQPENDNNDIHYDLNVMLNLNNDILKTLRKEIMDTVARRLPKQGTWSEAMLKSELEYWTKTEVKVEENHKKPIKTIWHKPFYQVAVWYIQRKLKKAKT